jgi:cytochrome c5
MLMENGEYSDERFIDAMVPHHQGAIEMAQVALENAEQSRCEAVASQRAYLTPSIPSSRSTSRRPGMPARSTSSRACRCGGMSFIPRIVARAPWRPSKIRGSQACKKG